MCGLNIFRYSTLESFILMRKVIMEGLKQDVVKRADFGCWLNYQ